MASYVDSNLSRNEHVILRAKVSWWSQWSLLLLGGITLLGGIGIAFLLIAILNVLTTELALTNKRVIAKTGFIRRDTVELRLEKVESLVVKQGVFGRMFNYGSIIISGTGGIATPIPYITNPLQFRRVVNEYLDNPEPTAQPRLPE